MQITASQFFPGVSSNSFLQMMCHYKEVYLNKFNTSLINPHRAPSKGHTPHQDGLHNIPPIHTHSHPHTPLITRVERGLGGKRIISWTTHLKQIFIYIFMSLLNFIERTHLQTHGCRHAHKDRHTIAHNLNMFFKNI